MIRSTRVGGELQRLAADFVFSALALLACIGVGSEASAAPALAPQGGRDPIPEVDPYTEGDPALMKKAGYESFGPFLFAGEHTTEVVEEQLGGVPLIFVETEHFKLGCSLDEIGTGGDREDKAALKRDLEELAEIFPSIKKKKPKKLDPWLRLHLYALRLERLYDDFLEAFELKEIEFPSPRGASVFLGKGPYLGLTGKFPVLLTQKKSSLARYTMAFCGIEVESSYRYYSQKSDSLFYGMSWETLEGAYQTDQALYFAVVFGVTQNLANGFRGFTHEGPLWWNLGLARWFARQVDDRFLLYTAPANAAVRADEKDTEWERRVRARVDNEVYPSSEEMLGWNDFAAMKFTDHMIAWSRVDFVMSLDAGRPRALLTAIQSPVPYGATRDAALAAQFERAIPDALGMDLAAFDAAWAEYVLANYKKK